MRNESATGKDRLSLSCLVGAALALAACMQSAQADEYYYCGPNQYEGEAWFSDPQNWTPSGGPPGSADVAIFDQDDYFDLYLAQPVITNTQLKVNSGVVEFFMAVQSMDPCNDPATYELLGAGTFVRLAATIGVTPGVQAALGVSGGFDAHCAPPGTVNANGMLIIGQTAGSDGRLELGRSSGGVGPVTWNSAYPTMVGSAGAEQPEVVFEDKTAEVGLEAANAAACWADFDNDGWVDLCVSGSVWKNDAGKRFTKVADVGSSVAADFDNDGLVDLFSWSELRLYRNQGGNGFVEFELPELPESVSRGACWGDLNGNGFVDLYVGGYETWKGQITWPSLLLVNKKGKAFHVQQVEKSFRARGVTACDFDRDGDLDVYVSNYRLQPNLLWLNDGASGLEEVADRRGAVASSPEFHGGHSIGACWGDFDNDGLIDLFAGNFAHVDRRGDQPKSRFLRNLGPEEGYRFRDLGTCGVHYQESYATPSAGDYDNDGDLDLFFTTVYATASFGKKNNSVLFRNDGQFRFTDVTSAAQLAGLPPTYQAAWADYDNDGDLDLLTAGKLFQNQGSENGWLEVRLVGDGAVNRSAIGAQVRIELGEQTLTRQVEAGTGEGNQNDLTLHFGLGQHKGPVSLKIFWPNKHEQAIDDVQTNRLTTIRFSASP